MNLKVLGLIIHMVALAACGVVKVPSADIIVFDYDKEVDYYGDCTLVKSGGQALLMDTCSAGAPVEEFLKENGVEELSIYISHYHNDHTGNAARIIRDMDVKTVYLPEISYMQEGYEGFDKHLADYHDIMEAAGQKDCEIVWLDSGDSFDIGYAHFNVLLLNDGADHGDFEDYDECSSYINNCSLVTMMTCGGIRFLTAGDIEAETERKLLDEGIDVDADIFKMDHHGGKTSNIPEFTDAVSPEYAFATYPGTKDEGWAAPIKRLSENCRVYNVYECGTTHLHLENGSIEKAQ